MLWLPVWINVTLAPNKLWVLLSFFFHCVALPLLGHQLWYREIVTKILLQWWKLTVSVLLVKCNFDPQANKANVLFVFMRFEILVVSLTLVTLSLSLSLMNQFLFSSYSLSSFLLSFPFLPLSSHFFSCLLLASPKLWIPTGPRENSHVSNMSPFSRDGMNQSKSKTRAGKVIT